MHPGFRLFLQTELPNPDYGPEIAAQCTLVNFSVTREGLEEQLLTWVSGIESPKTLAAAAETVRAIGALSGELIKLEDDLLRRLQDSKGDILDDMDLVGGLESTKKTAIDVQDRMAQAKVRLQRQAGVVNDCFERIFYEYCKHARLVHDHRRMRRPFTSPWRFTAPWPPELQPSSSSSTPCRPWTGCTSSQWQPFSG